MARALRVFTWSDGLHAYTVATTSKAKALEAWGVARDLFKDGEAKEISEGPGAEAALARPGEVIRGAVAVEVPDAPAKPRAKASSQTAPPKPKPKPKPSKADIARAHALECEIASVDRETDALETEVAARRTRIEREAAERSVELDRRRKQAANELAALRTKMEGR